MCYIILHILLLKFKGSCGNASRADVSRLPSKTSKKYTLLVYFSEFMKVHLLHYQDLTVTFLKFHKYDCSNKTPFFIDSKGDAFLRRHRLRLDWSDFAALSGMPRSISM